MTLRKIIWAFLVMIFLGGSALEMGCSNKSNLQKRTASYKRKVRKGKTLPCPCENK